MPDDQMIEEVFPSTIFEAFTDDGAIYAWFCEVCGAPPNRHCICHATRSPREKARSRSDA